ncbi:MAG: DUF5335 family protein [Acidobacteriota bacterium]
MTEVIRKQDWKGFLDRISCDFVDWETSVRILNGVNGAQVLTDGLPFNGISYDDKQGGEHMAVALGLEPDRHQTHSIEHPKSVMFELADRGPGGTLDIDDESGMKTLIEFRRPRPMLVEFVKNEILLVG